jgi:hypothetical protein
VAEHEITAIVAHTKIDLIVLVGFEKLQRGLGQIDLYPIGFESQAPGEREHLAGECPIVGKVGELKSETVGEQRIGREEQTQRDKYPVEQRAAQRLGSWFSRAFQ